MPLRFFFPICAFYKKIKRKESKKNQFFTKNLKKYLYKKEYYKGKKGLHYCLWERGGAEMRGLPLETNPGGCHG